MNDKKERKKRRKKKKKRREKKGKENGKGVCPGGTMLITWVSTGGTKVC